MYELPPILTGTSTQQITALRAYLVRMAQQLNSAADAPSTYAQSNAAGISTRYAAKGGALAVSGTAAAESDTAAVRKNAAELRQLILKTADGLSGDIGARGVDIF